MKHGIIFIIVITSDIILLFSNQQKERRIIYSETMVMAAFDQSLLLPTQCVETPGFYQINTCCNRMEVSLNLGSFIIKFKITD